MPFFPEFKIDPHPAILGMFQRIVDRCPAFKTHYNTLSSSKTEKKADKVEYIQISGKGGIVEKAEQGI